MATKLHLGSAVANTNPVVDFAEIMIYDLLRKVTATKNDRNLSSPY